MPCRALPLPPLPVSSVNMRDVLWAVGAPEDCVDATTGKRGGCRVLTAADRVLIGGVHGYGTVAMVLPTGPPYVPDVDGVVDRMHLERDGHAVWGVIR
jgi:hypothetical protein